MMDEKQIESLKRRYGSRIADAPKRRRGPERMAVMKGGKPKAGGQTMLRLLSYLKRDRMAMTAAFFCVILGTVTNLVGAYMLRPIINRYIVPLDGSRGDVAGLFRSLCVMGAVYLASVAASYMQSRIMLQVAQNALQRLREELFNHMQTLPLRFYDTGSNGDLMSRFTNDVDTIGMMLSSTLVQLLSGVLSIVGTLVLMIYTNVWLTVITLAMMPVMLRAGKFVAGRSQKYFSAQQAALGAMNGYIEETVQGQKVVKVFCHEEIAEEEFGWLNADLKEKQIRAQFFGGVMGPVMNNLSQLNYGLTACIGGLLCVFRNFDVGGLTVFLGFSRQFSRPINELSMQVGNVFSALAGAERVFAVLDAEPEAADASDAVSIAPIRGEVVLELDALRKMEKTDTDHHRANDARAALRRKLNAAEDAAAAAAHPQIQEKKVSARPVRVGDTVQLRKMGDIKATVTAVSADRTLSLRAGIMNVTAKEQDVYLLENEKPEAEKFAAAHAASLRSVAAESEIDLRGMDSMEAVAATERFLDNAVMAKLEKVTIIHGKGTGALRAAVQQSLRRNKAVKSFRLGRYGEGESGVTVVELK